MRGNVTPHHHGVIAKTEFSTWEFLLDAEFMGRGLIWPKHLSSVFRGPWPAHQAGAVLAHVRDLVATLRDFRNRLFHHEPAWKRYGVLTEADALLHLQEKISKMESLLALIHPENLRLLQANGLLRDAHRACTTGEIRRFQHLAQVHKVDSLGKLVNQSAVENSALEARVYQGRHPHPSGSLEPSRADEILTKHLTKALALVKVRVLDHIIVAGNATTSMAERGSL